MDETTANNDYEYPEDQCSLKKIHLNKLAFDFLLKLPPGYLGLLNDMVMILDPKKCYYRLLNPSEQVALNLLLVKKLINHIRKNYTFKIDNRTTCVAIKKLSASEQSKFCKIVYHEILLNRHLFCRTTLTPNLKHQNSILLSDGVAPFIKYPSLKLNRPIRARKKERFTFYLNIKSTTFTFNGSNSLILDFFKFLAKDNSEFIAKSRNLILNLSTNTPNDNLLFLITSENQRLLYLYIKLIESILPSNFCTYYSAKELLKKSTWLSLTTKVVNFTNKLELNLGSKSDYYEALKTLASGERISILKGNQPHNFTNKTILIFYGSEKDAEPLSNIYNNIHRISLPDNLDDIWNEPCTEKIFYKTRSDLLLFAYYGLDFNSHQPAKILFSSSKNNASNKPLVNPLDSFEKFFSDRIIITGNHLECILKTKLFEEYETFTKKSGLQLITSVAFWKKVKSHASYKEGNRNDKKLVFGESRKATADQLKSNSITSEQRILVGIKFKKPI